MSTAERRGQRGRRQAARIAAGLCLLSLGALAVVGWMIAGRDVPSPTAGAPTLAGNGGQSVVITWLGDTLLGDGAEPLIQQHGLEWLSAELPPLDPEHVVIANLEGPLTDRTEPFDLTQRWSYNTRPAAAQALAAMGVDAVSLANNHALDRGPEGLRDTFSNTGSAGLAAFGAGETVDQARLPLLIEAEAGTIAVLGFSDEGGVRTASSVRPGVRRLSPENIADDLERARRSGAVRVVAFVHWGENYATLDERQQTWARAFAAAGYDLVVGAGPHIAHPIAVVDGMPVIYSLGNYLFGTPGRFRDEQQGFGLVVSTSFTSGDELEIVARCIRTDNQAVSFQPKPCDALQTEAFFAAISADLSMTGADTGRLTLQLPSPAAVQR